MTIEALKTELREAITRTRAECKKLEAGAERGDFGAMDAATYNMGRADAFDAVLRIIEKRETMGAGD